MSTRVIQSAFACQFHFTKLTALGLLAKAPIRHEKTINLVFRKNNIITSHGAII